MNPNFPDGLLEGGMAHGRNKHQSRENRARVREILMRDWDPIGVSRVPEAADEYDRYVGKVRDALGHSQRREA